MYAADTTEIEQRLQGDQLEDQSMAVGVTLQHTP
jgi:hypothetical protein